MGIRKPSACASRESRSEMARAPRVLTANEVKERKWEAAKPGSVE